MRPASLLVILVQTWANFKAWYSSAIVLMGETSWKLQKRLRKTKPTPRKPSLSVNTCSYRTAPAFEHPETDACVNLNPINSRPGIKIYNSGICANGTAPMLARYSSCGCRDTPTSLTPIAEDKIKTCLNTDRVSSVSFRCTEEIVAPTPRLPKGPKAPLVRP